MSGQCERLHELLKRGEDVGRPRESDKYRVVHVNGDVREVPEGGGFGRVMNRRQVLMRCERLVEDDEV